MKSKYIILAVIAGLLSNSCRKLVQEDPQSFISPEKFYNTESDAISAITGVYEQLNSSSMYNHAMWWPLDMSTDDVLTGPTVTNAAILQIDQYTHGSDNTHLELIWQASYLGISRANEVIAKVPGINMDQKKKDRIVAEAKFLRAFYYFNLVRFFGDIPLITEPTRSLSEDLNVARSPKADVYKLIISDLIEASPNLDISYAANDANAGRATQGATKGILAKVYLTQQDWAKARDAANEVIQLKKYILLPNFADVFNPTMENHQESIFEAQFKTGLNGEGSRYFAFTGPRQPSQKPVIIVGGFGTYMPSLEIVNSYRTGDRRRNMIYSTYTFGSVTTTLDGPHVGKFFDPAVIGGVLADANNNYPILRYADIVLMYAEALEKTGNVSEARNQLNTIRRRAFGLPLTTPSATVDYPNAADLTQGLSLYDAIMQERRWELAFEGHRWFDLVRTGKLVSTLKAKGNNNIQEFHNLYPLPQREMDINTKLVQNPGYK